MLTALRNDRVGATAVEYGLIISLVILVMVTSLGQVASKTIKMWNGVADNVAAANQ